MTIRSLLPLGVWVLIAGLPIAIFAQTNSTNKDLKSADKSFARAAAQGGMAEVQMGKLAADKATTPALKAFAQRMVDDHSKANRQLTVIDRQIGITPPEGISAKEQAVYDSLSRLSGPAFDRAYTKVMVSDHQEDVKEFRKEASSGHNPELKEFASQTLPTLRSHLDTIRALESKPATEGTK